MTATFDAAGIRFHYPENWQVTDENLLEHPRTVALQSPGGGFWSLMVYEPDADSSELLSEALAQMTEEYENLESSAITETFDHVAGSGHEMYFYCLDFLVCAKVVVVRASTGQQLLLQWQAEDRDFTSYEPVFRAITVSLLRELASPCR